MRAPCRWMPTLALLLAFAAEQAVAGEQCAFARDPAFYARWSVPPASDAELAIGALNTFRLFDDEQDGRESLVLTSGQFRARVARIARYIAHDMGAPSLVALEEVEDETAADALAAALSDETGRRYGVQLGRRSNEGDIRSALLVDERLRVTGTQSLFDLPPRVGVPQHDRRPLVVDVDAGAFGPLTVIVVHMKSMRGMDRADDGPRVIAKRRTQATDLAVWLRSQMGRRLLLLGDFNAMPGPRDDPRSEPLRILLDDGGVVDPAVPFLAAGQRWTYRYRCNLQQIDHILVSPALAPRVGGYAIARGDTCLHAKEKCDSSRSVSDHEGVVLRLRR